MYSFVDIESKFNPECKKFNEDNDCTIVAFSLFLNLPYGEVRNLMMEKVDKKPRRGINILQFDDFSKQMGHGCTIPFLDKKPTINQFCKQHPVGEFIILVSGHAIYVKDGVVHDHTDGFKRKVKYYLEKEIKDELDKY